MGALRVVVVGESWHGSDCTGLARGFRVAGHAVELIGCDVFFPAVDRSFAARGLRRTMAPFFRFQFNRYVRQAVRMLRPDLVVIYKGTGVAPATLADIRRRGIWLCHVMPDTTIEGQWLLDRRIFRCFDHVFTTKSFGVDDFRARLGGTSVSFLAHGFDPYVHRPMSLDPRRRRDPPPRPVSFIGHWTPGKEAWLGSLAEAVGPEKLDVWGNGWERSRRPALRGSVRGGPIYGDYYAAAVCESRINLGLLRERLPGGPSGDLTTARTFQIPACGGFLLHERTRELAAYYEEGREVACFGSPEELTQKVRYYLAHDAARARIARAGHRRCVREHDLAGRARVIVERFLEARPSPQVAGDLVRDPRQERHA